MSMCHKYASRDGGGWREARSYVKLCYHERHASPAGVSDAPPCGGYVDLRGSWYIANERERECERAAQAKRMKRSYEYEPMKRPNRDLAANPALITNWPAELEAQVGKADAAIDKETDAAFRRIIQPSMEAWVAGTLKTDELELRRRAARAEARANHPRALGQAKLAAKYEEALVNLEKTEGALSRHARRTAGVPDVEATDSDS